ncbi:sensor histidine kinase [Burkholderia vietnamiensis]|uniref:sensor histidine kinase n=1 Tax=Burkholderia vietnamiensis TaxID=60552 RepID=UPI001CF22922|nr:sensor histidine kinase [Burkholderia vietnamiensis]MCA8291983.1 sensor histidine kinase [Burkholderia vietnamiensis]
MDLSEYISEHREALVQAWASYALTISRDDTRLSQKQLRNSAEDILAAIAADMRIPQSPAEQTAKSRGEGLGPESQFNRVARIHAEDRLSHGFSINDVVAEFRALRATVLRYWETTSPSGAAAFQQMIRFNEAIDQVLAESVRHYAQHTERGRDLFTAVLAHDLRSPLGAIFNASQTLHYDAALSPASLRSASSMQRSAMRMRQMIDDLLVFMRTRLGDTLPVNLAQHDISRIAGDAVDEVSASYPNAHIELRCADGLTTNCDAGRICQLIVNLLTNAARYGLGRIAVEAIGDDDQISIAISNEGNPIPEDAFPTLFDPLIRGTISHENDASTGMGLGLYICRCIANAHQGTIKVASGEHGTTFTVRIPCSRQ